ncbi:MAG: GTPase HflX [Rhodocyclaceae bacterium]|nr:GTPase HflX [Rhodocyclaceae bacterium]MCG3187917.1 GTPase HflX [Rhodocyclaceae bacterium]
MQPPRQGRPPRPRATLVQVDFGSIDREDRLDEFEQLVSSAGAEPVGMVGGRRKQPDAATFVGSGKVQEIASLCQAAQVDLVIFDHDLSPAQQRNLERALGVPVVDRTSLILDIFAQRAQSHEGKLQVELAQLAHLSSRLVRGWTHLERQKGGIGLRGPGETQLEVDRRLIGKRVKFLRERLTHIARQRAVRRRARTRGAVPSISLVGYTNAGKSTLFNALTHAESHTADQLFATLDTMSRRLYMDEIGGHVVLSDTVGFIRELPHTLVDAFHATLEETAQADLLLHVVDASNPGHDAQIDAVERVLAEIGASEVPTLIVWNKIDRTHVAPGVDRDPHGRIRRVRLSARTGAGLSDLRAALAEMMADPQCRQGTNLDSSAGVSDTLFQPARTDAVS